MALRHETHLYRVMAPPLTRYYSTQRSIVDTSYNDRPPSRARRALAPSAKPNRIARGRIGPETTTIIDLVDFEQTMQDGDDDDDLMDKGHRMEERFESSLSTKDLIVCGGRTFEVIHVEDVCSVSDGDDEPEPAYGDYDQIDEMAVLEAFPPLKMERDDDVCRYCSTSWRELIRANRWEECTTLLQQMLADPKATLRDEALVEPGHDTSLLHTASWRAPRHVLLLLLSTVLKECPNGESTRTSFSNSRERLRALLLSGDGQGNTPLHLACANLQHETDRYSMNNNSSAGEDKDMFAAIKFMLMTAPGALYTCNDAGDTPFHLLLASEGLRNRGQGEAANGVMEAISSLLQIAGGLTSVQNKRGLTLLHVALGNQCSEFVCRLVLDSTPVAALQHQDQYGMTPLHYGAAFGTPSLQLLRRLVERQASNLVESTHAGDTALHLFVANAPQNEDPWWGGHDEYEYFTDLLNLLGTEHSATTALSIRNNEDLTPLHCCALFGAPWQLTKAIAAAAPETTTWPASASQSTPLHTAILCFIGASTNPGLSHIRRRALLKNISVLITPDACEAVDAHGQTALLLAIQSDAVPSKILRRLVDASPSSVQIADPEGFLPVHRAFQTGHVSTSIMKASPSSKKSRTAAV